MSNTIEHFLTIFNDLKNNLFGLSLFSQYFSEYQWFLILIFSGILFIILYINQTVALERVFNLNQNLTPGSKAKIAAVKIKSEPKYKLEHEITKTTTALKLANQDLQKSTALMEKIANFTPNLIYVYDLQKKCHVYSNKYIEKIIGYSAAEIEEINMQLFDKLVHSEDIKLVEEHHQKCLTLASDDYLEIEYRLQDRFGQWHWLHSKDRVFKRDKSGQPTQILGITQDITETKRIRAESVKLNSTLSEKVATLEMWHKRRIKLGQMNEFLQACLTISEAKSVLSDMLPKLFPGTHGVVYLMNNSKNLLNAIAFWGLAHSKSSFEPHECWSLRKSSPHIISFAESGLHCKHIEHQSSSPSLCQPMIAKGKTLGMLYLRFDSSTDTNILVEELVETVAQNIAMSFANLTLQEKLRYQSLRDPLTGLHNRRYLQESLDKEIERARRKQNFIGIMMLDIDYFKRFNDVYGHSAGDLVLKQVANYLLSEIRQYDIACRYGGEELVLVMPDAPMEDTIIRAEEIRAGISKLKLEHEGKQLESISVSIGISCFPDDGTTVDALIKVADKALYQAKIAGRNCVQRC